MAAVACVVGFWSLPGYAELPPPEPMRPGQDRVDEMMGRYNLYPAFQKGGRGLSNFLGGWMEIPLQVHLHRSRADTAGSFFTGLAHGIVKGLVRTGVGAYEAVTFFLPYPENYAPVLPTLAYFQKTRREPLPLE
jgi:putative exosortase-associated protein (TIGR04073 family)